MDASTVEELPLGCARCAVRSRSLCSVLSPSELWALNAASRHRRYESGQVVVTEGDAEVFANVVAGMLVEKKTLADGREQIVSLLFPADFLGNHISGIADATVEAISPTVVCTFEQAGFDKALRAHPALRQAVLEHALTELRNARAWMLLLGQMNAGERVATFLLRLATRQTEAGCTHFTTDCARDGAEFDIPITRAQMADYLGLTIETVSRKMTALRDSEVIDLVGTRRVRLRNVDRLASASR